MIEELDMLHRLPLVVYPIDGLNLQLPFHSRIGLFPRLLGSLLRGPMVYPRKGLSFSCRQDLIVVDFGG